MGKIGRNNPCPCGSLKKYKQCCLNKDQENGVNERPSSSTPREAILTLQNLKVTPLNTFFQNYAPQLSSLDKALNWFKQNKECKLYLLLNEDNNLVFFLKNNNQSASLLIRRDASIAYAPGDLNDQAYCLLLMAIKGHPCPLQTGKEEWNQYCHVLHSWSKNKNAIYLEKIIFYSPLLDGDKGKIKNLSMVQLKKDDLESNVRELDQRVDIRIVNIDSQVLDFIYSNDHDYYSPFYYHQLSSFCIFKFSNGVSMSYKELWSHIYSLIIPPSLFPSKSDMKPFNTLGANSSYRSSFRKKDVFFLKYIIRAVKDSSSHQAKIFIREKEDYYHSNRKISSIPVTHFKEIPSKDYVWELQEQKLKFTIKNAPSSLIWISDYFAYNNQTQTLVQSNAPDQIYASNSICNNHNRINDNQNSYEFDLPCNLDVENLFSFRKYIKEKAGGTFKDISAVKIKDKDIKLNISIPSNNESISQITLSLAVIPENCPTFNASIPSNLKYFIDGVEYGLAGECGQETTELANRSNRWKRQFELKFLKHSGLFIYLSFELLKYKRENPSISSKDIKKFTKDIQSKIELFFFKVSQSLIPHEEEPIPLKELLSQKVIKVMNQWINKFLNNEYLTELYTINNGIIYQLETREHFLKLIELIMDWTLFDNKEKNIFKQSIPKKVSFDTVKHDQITIYHHNARGAVLSNVLNHIHNKDFPIEVLVDNRPLQSISEQDFKTEFNLNENTNSWFDLHPKLFFQGEEVSPDMAYSFFNSKDVVNFKGQFYILNPNKIPSLKWLDYFWSNLEGKKKDQKFESKNTIQEQAPSLVFQMLALRKAGIPIQASEKWELIFKKFDQLEQREKYSNILTELNQYPELTSKLFSYQKNGVQWLIDLYQLGIGGILADDMGLGKTVQAITFLRWLKVNGDLKNILIVVPTSLVYNWFNEFKKFAPEIPIQLYNSKEEDRYLKNGVTISTYGLTTANSNFFTEKKWQIVIYDEAQNLKNIKSQRTTIARKIDAQNRFCLTGTPLENHYGEYYSLIDLAVPGVLGSYGQFIKKYSFKNETKLNNIQRDVEFLKILTSPIVLRRLKEKVLDELPDKRETTLLLDFEKKQSEIYKNVAISYNDMIKDKMEEGGTEQSAQFTMLTALLRLRQICSSPSSLPNIQYDKMPPKFEALLASLDSLKEEKKSVLIFTNFKSTLHQLETLLKNNDHKVFVLTGDIPLKKRKSILEDFERFEGPSVVLMTLKVGGVGLNLTKANYVFHVEPWWNPAVENQATDRAHRLGQKQAVQVYRYIIKDSLEERIQDLKKVKFKAFQSLFNNEEDNKLSKSHFSKTHLSVHDFNYLIDQENHPCF